MPGKKFWIYFLFLLYVAETEQQFNMDTNVGCGTIRVQPGAIVKVDSSNFGFNYYNNEACTRTFTASDCNLSVYCPCFDIPSSFKCVEDYLKISYLKFNDRFCGDNSPVGVYRATSDFLTLRFKSDYKQTGKGFRCYVRCTKTGMADPVVGAPIECPDGAINKYGVAN